MRPPSLLRVLTLSLPRARRRLHRAVARPPPLQPQTVAGLSSEYLHAIYEDLMLDPQSDVDVQVQAPGGSLDDLLADHAQRGNIRDIESVMSALTTPTDYQRDLHVKAHIISASLPSHSSSFSTIQHFPTGAIAILHKYEASGLFAPIKSYTRVISALFNVKTHPSSDPGLSQAAARAQAWDLFAHMRYVAHPVPDAHLYALMIRACGSFSRPEPERALDLWMEMHENGVKPTRGAYEAIVKVCGRAGPEWLGEGIKFAREMSDHYSITGVDGRGLWCALLEGCKRAGDLEKARWILAEAVRGSSDGASSEDSVVDAELMTHIFHTYASYEVPFRRETMRLVDPSAASNEQVTANENQAEESSHSSPATAERTQDGSVPIENTESVPSFSRLPPQTSSDVIAETRALFDRILYDRYSSTEGTGNSASGGFLAGRFARVKPAPVLVNAYLSVFYRHASIETSREVFNSLFSNSHSSVARVLHPDEHTYVNALERCAIAPVEERYIAAQWAKDVWQRWEIVEANVVRSGKGNVGPFARLIERAHTAMRRVLVLSGDIDNGLALLRTFVSRYPPNSVLHLSNSRVLPDGSPVGVPTEASSKSMTAEPFSKPHILSTRTILTNPASSISSTARPLVRLTSAAMSKDGRVPPIVAFSDVDVLHARLAEHGRIKDLGYIKWVCLAYTNALKKRRGAILRAAPRRDEDGVD